MSGDQQTFLDIREHHYEAFLGPLDQQIMHSTDVKTPHIDIYQFAPSTERPFWTLITGGMSDLRQPGLAEVDEIPQRAELMMYVSEPQGWMFSVLKGLAEMSFDDDTYLQMHHTVPNGQPMTATPSLLTGYFFVRPLLEPDEFENFQIDGDDVSFLLVIPITDEEREFAVANSSQTLEDVMAEAGLDPVVDEARPSLV